MGEDTATNELVLLQLKDILTRVERIEVGEKKSFFKSITTSASTSALFLGLVLTFATMYDTFVSKPEADRVTRIGEFNKAVNAAAKTRQELVQFQLQTMDSNAKLMVATMITPQIANNISTARAILRDLKQEDVEIPQLIVLMFEAFSMGDLVSAKAFVERAVGKKDVAPFLRSEALRYEGKYYFLLGKPDQARQSFEAAIKVLGDAKETASVRAFVLADLSVLEYQSGDCNQAVASLERTLALTRSQSVPRPVQLQISASLKAQFVDAQGVNCALPVKFSALFPE